MQDKAGIARDEGGLAEALDELQQLKTRAQAMGVGGSREYNPGWHTALDLQNLLTVAEAVVMASDARKESRGAHSRLDYLDKDPEWGTVNLVLKKGHDGEMELRREGISKIPKELRKIIEEQG